MRKPPADWQAVNPLFLDFSGFCGGFIETIKHSRFLHKEKALEISKAFLFPFFNSYSHSIVEGGLLVMS